MRHRLVIALIATLAGAVGAPAAEGHLFARPAVYPTQNPPQAIAVGDLNGDGIPDLAVSEGYYAGQVEVLLSQAPGKFGSASKLGNVSFPGGLAIADVYGNGKPAVVATDSSGSGAVVVFPGDGHGGFGAPQRLALPSPAQPAALAVGDVNEDGHPDIVVAEPNHDAVYLLLGQPGGGFAAPAALAAGRDPEAVTLARLTGSGHLDLIVANRNPGTVTVLRGNGNGSFQAPQTIPIGGAPRALAVSDLNGDGIPDVIVPNATQVVPLLGSGSGSFAAQTPVQDGSSGIAVADFTGDGVPDLATFGPNIYPGTGGGSFGAALQSPFVGSFPAPTAISAGDLNGDGKADIAMGVAGDPSSGEPTGVAVFLNSTGVAGPAPTLAAASRAGCYVVKPVTQIPLLGSGFYPGDDFTLTATGFPDGASRGGSQGQVASDGSVHTALRLQANWFIRFKPATLTITVTDRQDQTVHAATSVLVTPPAGNSTLVGPYVTPRRKATFQFIGFAPGATVYEHYVFGAQSRKTVRLGRVSGPCGAFKVTVKRWAVSRPFGRWRLQFDSSRRYSRRAPDRHVWQYILTRG